MPDLVYLNGDARPWRPGLNLLALLKGEPPAAETGKVATALNGEFVPEALRAHTLLQPGDQVTVFTAIVGG
ncbi:sulfur carrier protein ThiS [Piscinibacter sp. HJYY11]|uniref:sulfur carrier protein ThiS n=1 Tax=Piscinibacter sp. HJYY11 TaxID=2801333 RepID=UPI00191F8A2C|nr:sulfur carrier protein ThiS [Piscinibacter sp. HJYY11]MBL0730091.1 sulfur carrier protein ThiS [Piscinibacter sp. HJYY11]